MSDTPADWMARAEARAAEKYFAWYDPFHGLDAHPNAIVFAWVNGQRNIEWSPGSYTIGEFPHGFHDEWY